MAAKQLSLESINSVITSLLDNRILEFNIICQLGSLGGGRKTFHTETVIS